MDANEYSIYGIDSPITKKTIQVVFLVSNASGIKDLSSNNFINKPT